MAFSIVDILFAVFLFLVVIYLIKTKIRSTLLPPGPMNLPVFGSYFSMTFPFRRWLPGAHKKCGPIVGFQMAGKYWISIANLDLLQETLLKQHIVFSGRPQNLWSKSIFKNGGLVLGDGSEWRFHKSTCLRYLRKFGFGTQKSQALVFNEIDALLKDIHEMEGRVVDISKVECFAVAACNTITSIVFNQRLASEDKDFHYFLNSTNVIMQKDIYNGFATTVLMPIVMKVFPQLLTKIPSVRNAAHSIQSVIEICEDYLEKQRCNMVNNNYSDNFVQFVMNMVDEEGDDSKIDSSRLAVTIFDLIIGGFETISNTMRWILIEMADNPEIQEELFKQLDACDVNELKYISYDRQMQFPLVNAVILEAWRLHPILPTAITHRTTEDTTLGDYFIPKDSFILPNLALLHRDATKFTEPDVYDPYRYINEDGSFTSSKYVIPFSIGRRSCIGESLAKMEVFVFVANIFRNYKVQFAGNNNDLKNVLHGTDGYSLAPLLCHLQFLPRNTTWL